MAKTEIYPSTHLNLWEAICWLAYGIASENGGGDWREAKIADDRRASDEIIQEEVTRFFWATKMLEQAAKAGKIQVLGHRKHHAELLPIPPTDFIHSGFDPVGKTGGCLNPAEATVDYDRRVWMGLQFRRTEIEEMRTVCRFTDPAATTAETKKIYENWTDRAVALRRKDGKTWEAAAHEIATSDGVDSHYVARQVRMIRAERKARKRENGKPI